MRQLIWLGTSKDLLFCFGVFCFCMALAMHSCTDVETGPQAGKPEYEIGKIVNESGDKFEIIQIDSCEYIYYSLFSSYGMLTHKGNCKNSIHIYNK